MSDTNQTQTLESVEEVRTACDEAIEAVNDADLGADRPAYESFIDPLAAAHVDGVADDALVDECLTRLKAADGTLNKPNLESMFKERVEDHTPEDQKKKPLESWLSTHCTKVIEVKNDDTELTEYYKWVIEIDGEEYRVETEEEHNNWFYFTDRLKRREMGFAFGEPANHRDMGDWKQWVWDFIDSRRVVEEKEGPRTLALEDLQNRLEVSQVYLDLDKANTHSRGVYMESRDADVMYVSSSLISTIAEEHGLKDNNVLQDELDNRGDVDGSASKQFELENGQRVRFWELPTSFADVQPPADETAPADRARGGAGGD